MKMQGRSPGRAHLEQCSSSEVSYFIEAYWRKRGLPLVRVWAGMMQSPGKTYSAVEIQSNLLNGRPRGVGEGEGRRNPEDSRRILQHSKGRYDERVPGALSSPASHDSDGADTGIDEAQPAEDRDDLRGQASYNGDKRDQTSEGAHNPIPENCG